MRFIAIILGALALTAAATVAPAHAAMCNTCETSPPSGGGGGGGGGSSAAAVTVTGTFTYGDRDPASGGVKASPIAHARVEIWRFAPRDGGVWTWVAERNATTDANGRVSVAMPFVDKGVVYGLRVFAENYAAVVYPNDAAQTVQFHREPGEPDAVINKTASAPGEVLDFTFHFADQYAAQHYNIADTLRYGFDYARARRDPRESDPLPRVDVQPTSMGGSYYHAPKDTLIITSGQVFEDFLILHEYAHFLQEQISSLAWIIGNHDGCRWFDAKQAWLEGFADYFAQAVAARDPGAFEGNAGVGTPAVSSIERPVCAGVDGSVTGDQLELFVAASLWDLVDRAAEPHDTVEDRDTEIFQIFDRELDTQAYPTLGDFRRAWIARGLGVEVLDPVLAGNRIAVPGFARLDGELLSAPAVAASGSGRLDAFVRGSDNGLYQKRYADGAWGTWVPVTGDWLTSDPAAVSWGPGRLDVFFRGRNNTLRHRAWDEDGGWGRWEDLGGVLTSGPAVASWAPGRLDVFVKGVDDALYHKWLDLGGWSEWERLGGKFTDDPAAVSWGYGRIDVFVRGEHDGLFQLYYDNGWSGWIPHGGGLSSGPTVASWAIGRLDVFVRGTDDGLYQLYYDNGWSGWVPHGGQLASDPEAVSWGPGRLDVFTRGSDSALWHKWFDGSWGP